MFVPQLFLQIDKSFKKKNLTVKSDVEINGIP